jgi:hypothetical protein
MKTISEWIDGNVALKAFLYFGIPFLTIWAAALAKWSETPPTNYYAIGEVAVVAFVSGLTAIKALMSNPKGNKPQ